MRDAYLEFLFANFIRSPKYDKIFGGEWVTAKDLVEINRTAFVQAFDDYDFRVIPESCFENFVGVFNEVLVGGGISCEGDEFTGQWYRINTSEKSNIIKRMLANNPATVRLGNLGDVGPIAYRRALRQIVADALSDETEGSPSEIQNELTNQEVPASDRIVKFSHNQMVEFDVKATEVILEVEKINGFSDEPDLRELIIGQLRAGREFIRAGCVRVYLLQRTLIDSLQLLAKRYEKEAIGALASALAAALLKHIGLDS